MSSDNKFEFNLISGLYVNAQKPRQCDRQTKDERTEEQTMPPPTLPTQLASRQHNDLHFIVL